jgi:hypothetical protein
MGHDNIHMYTQMKTCPVCDKKFVCSVSDWAYKIEHGTLAPKFFCSWHCIQAYRAGLEAIKQAYKGGETNANRK